MYVIRILWIFCQYVYKIYCNKMFRRSLNYQSLFLFTCFLAAAFSSGLTIVTFGLDKNWNKYYPCYVLQNMRFSCLYKLDTIIIYIKYFKCKQSPPEGTKFFCVSLISKKAGQKFTPSPAFSDSMFLVWLMSKHIHQTFTFFGRHFWAPTFLFVKL